MANVRKNIVLIGFMGAGKTLISKQLALALGRERVSTDELIEKRERRAITEIFEKQGEPAFRELEESVIEKIADKEGLVIDCGGGIPLSENNMSRLKEKGIIIYLQAKPGVVFRRIKHMTHRPLLKQYNTESKIAELMKSRIPHYEKADFTVDSNSDNIEQTTKSILRLITGDRTGSFTSFK